MAFYFLPSTRSLPSPPASQTKLLQFQLGASPVPSLGVILDGVARTQPDPLGKGAVLLGLLGQDSLDPEGFLGWLRQLGGIVGCVGERGGVSYVIGDACGGNETVRGGVRWALLVKARPINTHHPQEGQR